LGFSVPLRGRESGINAPPVSAAAIRGATDAPQIAATSGRPHGPLMAYQGVLQKNSLKFNAL
jgi:hypothetical protein